MLKLEQYYSKGYVVLDTSVENFTAPDINYYFDAWVYKNGEVTKRRYLAKNNKEKEVILRRFLKRAINCKRFMVENPLNLYEKDAVLSQFIKVVK